MEPVWAVDDDETYRDLLAAVLQTYCGVPTVWTFAVGREAVPTAVVSTAATSRERARCVAEGAIAFVPKCTRVEDLIGSLLPLTRSALPSGHPARHNGPVHEIKHEPARCPGRRP